MFNVSCGQELARLDEVESLAHAKDFAEDWFLELKGKSRAGELKSGKTFKQAADQFLLEYETIAAGERALREKQKRSAAGESDLEKEQTREKEPRASTTDPKARTMKMCSRIDLEILLGCDRGAVPTENACCVIWFRRNRPL